MFVNDKYFSLPPFISTSWEHVIALNLEDNGTLVVVLSTGKEIRIPNLKEEDLSSIFKAHGYYLEREIHRKRNTELEQKAHANSPFFNPAQSGELPLLRFGVGATDGFGAALQHNPAQSDGPELPPEILEKISGIAKILAPDDFTMFPLPEDNCNCFHCQIARAIRESIGIVPEIQLQASHEEVVSDEDLTFQEWDIVQSGEKLFTVTNKLSPEETYNVFLGNPVGCTCGNQGCEHIHVVLKS